MLAAVNNYYFPAKIPGLTRLIFKSNAADPTIATSKFMP
jgi:hypothetical protein